MKNILPSAVLLLVLLSPNCFAQKLYFTATGQSPEGIQIIRSFKLTEGTLNYAEYPFKVSVFWPYKDQMAEMGMPKAALLKDFSNFEDKTIALEKMGLGHMSVVFTGNGVRAWHWHVKDPEQWRQSYVKVVENANELPIIFDVKHDPEWRMYDDLIKNMDWTSVEFM